MLSIYNNEGVVCKSTEWPNSRMTEHTMTWSGTRPAKVGVLRLVGGRGWPPSSTHDCPSEGSPGHVPVGRSMGRGAPRSSQRGRTGPSSAGQSMGGGLELGVCGSRWRQRQAKVGVGGRWGREAGLWNQQPGKGRPILTRISCVGPLVLL